MKKILMAVFALAVAATVATAGVGIQWSVSWGAYDHAQADLTGGSGNLLASYSAIWQLIYAGADNTANNPSTSLGVAGIADDYVTGDDVVWGERSIAMGGGSGNDAPYNTSWDSWMLNTAGNVVYQDLSWSTAGFVYQRVFEGTPAANSWYYQTSLLSLVTTYTGGGQAPQSFYLDTANAGFKPTSQLPGAVPEPATMSLLGLGALVMAIRRRRA